MSKRPASGSPQGRPAKKNASNSHRVIGPLTPRHEQVCPHEGCPHHNHAATTSDPRQHLTPGSIYGSPAQASHGRYIEYPWHLMPPTPNSTDPIFYQSRRLPSPQPASGFQTTLPPLSISYLLNPFPDDHHSTSSPLISTRVSPQTERRQASKSTETIHTWNKTEKSTKAPETVRQKSRGPRARQKKTTKERNSGPSPERPPHEKGPLRLRNDQRQDVSVEFTDVAAHTAKCDTCNNRNRDGMTRCTSCGWQCCRQCLGERGGNRSHQSFTSTHVPADERRSTPHTPDSPMLAPRPVPGGSGVMSTAADRAAANTLVDIAFDASPKKPDRNAHLDHGHFHSDSGYPAVESGIGGSGRLIPRILPGDWMFDSQMAGEEFDNPRRNPSRKARPIDLAE